jgi:hypothetical protein
MLIFTFTHVFKLVLPITFFDAFFTTFSRIGNQREILGFLISFFILFFLNIFLAILALFEYFEAKRAKNGSKNQPYFVNVS